MTGNELQDSNIRAQLEELISLGPRMLGSERLVQAAGWIVDRMTRMGLEVSEHPFEVDAWEPLGEARLETLTPPVSTLECEPMIWSAGTPAGGVRGRLEFVGHHGIWNGSYTWQKYALVSDGQPQAFVSARVGGPAIPQPRPEGSADHIPHVVIGEEEGNAIARRLQRGETMEARLHFSSRREGKFVGRNLMADIPGIRGHGGLTAIACAHYDSMWTTPGAYDNGSGVVGLLAVAEKLLEHPPARPVRVIFFSAEEWHLAGSRAFVDSLDPKDLASFSFVLNLDGIGRGRLLEVSVGPEAFEWDVRRLIGAHGGEGIQCVTRFPPLMGTDHAPFYEAGVAAAHLTFNDWSILHRFDDTPNDESVANIVYVADLARYLLDHLPDRGNLRA